MRQQNEEAEGDQTKKIKRMQQTKRSDQISQKKKNINSLMSGILTIQNYTKYISIIIRHQQKSISILPKQLKQNTPFRELDQRVNKCIQRARINNDFLNKVIKNYSQYLNDYTKTINKGFAEKAITPNSIVNIFIHVIKQWSQLFKTTRNPMYQVVGILKKLSIQNTQNQNLGPRIFVQGSGMGRILYEIANNVSPKPEIIQSCEDRVLHYLFCQYFLQADKSSTIYPFIHDFSNKYQTFQPYQAFNIPQIQQITNQQKINGSKKQIFYPNFGSFIQEYSSNQHNNQWNIFISYLCSERVSNVLKWIQIVYKGLRQKGYWILVCYASFESNVVPITYQQFRQILAKTQFKIIQQYFKIEEIISDRGMTKQKIKVHYLIFQK